MNNITINLGAIYGRGENALHLFLAVKKSLCFGWLYFGFWDCGDYFFPPGNSYHECTAAQNEVKIGYHKILGRKEQHCAMHWTHCPHSVSPAQRRVTQCPLLEVYNWSPCTPESKAAGHRLSVMLTKCLSHTHKYKQVTHMEVSWCS